MRAFFEIRCFEEEGHFLETCESITDSDSENQKREVQLQSIRRKKRSIFLTSHRSSVSHDELTRKKREIKK